MQAGRTIGVPRRVFSGWLTFVLAWSGLAYAEDRSPGDWLAAMNDAFVARDYDGVFSYYNGTDLATLRVVHVVLDGVQHERLVHLNGAPREVVRKGDEVSCILMPGDELIELERSIPSGPFARAFVRRFDRISNHYRLSLAGRDRVAAREAVRLSVQPRDEHRYGYRLWLDAESALLLRSEMFDASGANLELFQFTQLRLGDDVDPAAAQPENAAGSLVSHLKLAKEKSGLPASESPRWRAGWLPPGYAMASADIRRAPLSNKGISTLVYSDGLAVFSVFIEEMPPAGAASMESRMGGTVAVTHWVDRGAGAEQLVTVVGELPVPTARRIAGSIVADESAADE